MYGMLKNYSKLKKNWKITFRAWKLITNFTTKKLHNCIEQKENVRSGSEEKKLIFSRKSDKNFLAIF